MASCDPAGFSYSDVIDGGLPGPLVATRAPLMLLALFCFWLDGPSSDEMLVTVVVVMLSVDIILASVDEWAEPDVDEVVVVEGIAVTLVADFIAQLSLGTDTVLLTIDWAEMATGAL